VLAAVHRLAGSVHEPGVRLVQPVPPHRMLPRRKPRVTDEVLHAQAVPPRVVQLPGGLVRFLLRAVRHERRLVEPEAHGNRRAPGGGGVGVCRGGGPPGSRQRRAADGQLSHGVRESNDVHGSAAQKLGGKQGASRSGRTNTIYSGRTNTISMVWRPEDSTWAFGVSSCCYRSWWRLPRPARTGRGGGGRPGC